MIAALTTVARTERRTGSVGNKMTWRRYQGDRTHEFPESLQLPTFSLKREKGQDDGICGSARFPAISRMNSPLADLSASLGEVMAADYRRIKTRLTDCRPAQKECRSTSICARTRAWQATCPRRAAPEALPQPDFPPELPINERREDIARAIREHQLIIVCGETGSGKTTQLPKICLDLQRGTAGQIACTQPRRIAARSVAARLSQELRSPLGEAVGYKIRFTDKTRPESYIKVMTDGILLAETQGDRDLAAYDTIIIDEAHERSLNIDFSPGAAVTAPPARSESHHHLRDHRRSALCPAFRPIFHAGAGDRSLRPPLSGRAALSADRR
jgi:hypothetical protein